MKIRTVLSKLLLSYVSNVFFFFFLFFFSFFFFLTKVTEHLCLLKLNIFSYNKTVNPNWPYSLLGKFANIIYKNKDSFLHRTGDVCTL